MTKATILCIEDNENLQTVMRCFLEDQGYTILTGADGKDLLATIQAMHVDLILLDLGLPDGDGLNLMAQARLHTKSPIIVVSGKDDPTDKILGLELGADDYIGKPFEMRELYARIKAVLRRTGNTQGTDTATDQKTSAQKLAFGDWIMDRSSFSVVDKKNKPADLTTAEFRLLEILLNAAGRAISREQLSELSRGQDYQSYDRAIDIHIAHLRKKLGDTGRPPKLIKTIRGVGYMFCEQVSIIDPNS